MNIYVVWFIEVESNYFWEYGKCRERNREIIKHRSELRAYVTDHAMHGAAVAV